MNTVYIFPKAAAFGRKVAKRKIYQHATPSTKVKNLFVQQVEKIAWAYKLSPATINLPASDGVQEIQVFTLSLRTGELSRDILHTIDKAIPSPILFELDGFKRAITFSILRSYVQLSQNDEWKKEDDKKKTGKDKFLFLFEEPELYLHPSAQNILFDALSLISKKHQVLVTTHSPLFFSADDTTTFVKIAKRNYSGLDKPVGECMPIDLTDIREKDKFQLISFESSNLAFFSKKIVLVEGDSELIVFPHIAKLLNKKWDFNTSSASIIKINGKGSFKRYKDFFERAQPVDIKGSTKAILQTSHQSGVIAGGLSTGHGSDLLTHIAFGKIGDLDVVDMVAGFGQARDQCAQHGGLTGAGRCDQGGGHALIHRAVQVLQSLAVRLIDKMLRYCDFAGKRCGVKTKTTDKIGNFFHDSSSLRFFSGPTKPPSVSMTGRISRSKAIWALLLVKAD